MWHLPCGRRMIDCAKCLRIASFPPSSSCYFGLLLDLKMTTNDLGWRRTGHSLKQNLHLTASCQTRSQNLACSLSLSSIFPTPLCELSQTEYDGVKNRVAIFTPFSILSLETSPLRSGLFGVWAKVGIWKMVLCKWISDRNPWFQRMCAALRLERKERERKGRW